jgi:phosphoglycolate phosphatase-like HAD superfamily hydrolase
VDQSIYQSPPIVLDLDGVIVQSNRIKHLTMLTLFEEHVREYADIDAYIAANYGMRRDRKFAHIIASILGIEPTDALIADYLTRYDAALAPRLHDAPLVPGIDLFLRQARHGFYVSSSAPDIEVRDQLAHRGLASYFKAVYGASTPKTEALRQVQLLHSGQVPIFFGDSPGDWEAAIETKAAFVGVTAERDNFPDQAIVKLRDFSSMSTTDAAMRAALAMRTP